MAYRGRGEPYGRGSSAPRGKPSGRGGRHKPPSGADGIDEEFQIAAQKAMTNFRDDESIPDVVFPSTLSNTERKYVHFLASKLGLVSKSSGKGDDRRLTVRRKGKTAVLETHLEPELEMSAAGEALLRSYFRAWPVTIGELRTVDKPLAGLLEAEHRGGGGRPTRRNPGPRKSLPVSESLRAKWAAAHAARQAHPDHAGVMAGRMTLPAWAARGEVVSSLLASRVVIVCGETGCGKSTQVPQFLLDSDQIGPGANVIVTQPRRISAIALAERVASERCEAVGSSVGYNVRLESAMSADTRLLFCTTGVLLRRLTGSAADAGSDASLSTALQGVTHIILDEVHERELNCDFLLALLRDALMSGLYPTLTLVLMSATINLDMFASYFKDAAGPTGPAIVRMAGSAFPVTRYYLEDALLASGYLSGGRLVSGLPGGRGDKQGQAERLASLVARVKGEVLLPDHLTDTGIPTALMAVEKGVSGIGISSSARVIPSGAGRDGGDMDPASLRCTLCGKRTFASMDDFGMHAALCFGEPDEEAQGVIAGGAVPAPALAPLAVTVQQQGASSTLHLSLPVGAKGKALAKAAAAGGQGAQAPAEQGGGEEEEEVKLLLDDYQATLPDDETVDIDLLVHILGYIVTASMQGSIKGRAPSTPMLSSPVAGAAHAKGAAHPSDAGMGAVLVFLPGWEDISNSMEALRAHPLLGNAARTLVLPLHSQLPVQEQRRVFKRAPIGVTKIILATNIAETSITIDDVVYVIDGGRVREKTYDPYTGCSALTSVYVSQASARQRAGRAGRVRPGIAYHLFSRARHSSMAAFAVPEMLRMPLEELVLQVLTLGHTDVAEFLGRVVQPPAPAAVRMAVQVLMDIGAIRAAPGSSLAPIAGGEGGPATHSMSSEGKEAPGGVKRAGKAPAAIPTNLILTPLGRRLSVLPISPRLGVALLWSIALRCFDPVVTVAAASGGRPPWVLPLVQQDRPRADRARLGCARGARSDHAALLGAFLGFHAARSRGGGAPFSSAEVGWCRDNFVSGPALNMITAVRGQLADELYQAGIMARVIALADTGASIVQCVPAGLDRNVQNALRTCSLLGSSLTLITSVIAAGLYPNLARANPPSQLSGGRDSTEDGDGGKGLPRMETRSARKVQLHVSSLNSTGTASLAAGLHGGPPGAAQRGGRGPSGALAGQPPNRAEWLVYEEQANSGSFGTVSLKNTTVVHPLALVLLCGAAAAGMGSPLSKAGSDGGFESLIQSTIAGMDRSPPTAEVDLNSLVGQVVGAIDAQNKAADDEEEGNEGGDDDDDEDGEVDRGAPNARRLAHRLTRMLYVDSWARMRCSPAIGVPLSLLRSRLASSFTRTVVLPRPASTSGPGPRPSDPEVSRDAATFDLTARLLVLEAEGPAALSYLPRLVPSGAAPGGAQDSAGGRVSGRPSAGPLSPGVVDPDRSLAMNTEGYLGAGYNQQDSQEGYGYGGRGGGGRGGDGYRGRGRGDGGQRGRGGYGGRGGGRGGYRQGPE